MAQLELQPVTAHKSRRRMPSTLRIDMTPMVDLGFLLITFFIFTTTMSEPRAMKLAMPKDSKDSTEVMQSRALSLILGADNQVFAYEGIWDEAVKTNRVVVTNYHVGEGIGNLIRDKQKKLQSSDEDGKDALMLMIKPLPTSSYKNLIDALDEALINNVKKYAIVEPSVEEKDFPTRNR